MSNEYELSSFKQHIEELRLKNRNLLDEVMSHQSELQELQNLNARLRKELYQKETVGKPVLRHDLEGRRVQDGIGPDVWLVLFGQKHYIDGPEVYGALFDGVDGIMTMDDLELIEVGFVLQKGSCLIRNMDSGVISMCVPAHPRPLILPIRNYETFTALSLANNKIIEVPSALVDHIGLGSNIQTYFP